MKENKITVIMQGFYGNRTMLDLSKEDIDYKLQGVMDKKFGLDYDKDITIVKIPDTKCVIVYNKYQELDTLERNKKWFDESRYVAKPLAFIPEENIEIYSRCFACRVNENGELESIENEDLDIVFQYLA